MFTEIREWKDPILFPLFGDAIWRRKGTKNFIEWKSRMRDIIHTEKFESTLNMAITILNMINIRLNKCQSDSLCVSDVYHDWMQLKIEMNSINLPSVQKQYLINQIDFRWEF